MNVEDYKTWIGGILRRCWQAQVKAVTEVNVDMTRRMEIAEKRRGVDKP